MTVFPQRLIAGDAPSWRKLAGATAVTLFAVPLVLELTTPDMAWSPFDFVVFAALLALGGGAFELMLRFTGGNVWSCLASALAIGGAFVLVMTNLAVGIIGSEHNPVNLLFFALLGAGACGALLVRLRAAGLARVLALMAIAQLALGLGLALSGLGYVPVFTLVFAAIWLGSATLFRKAAQSQK